jgi:hypothetical protein
MPEPALPGDDQEALEAQAWLNAHSQAAHADDEWMGELYERCQRIFGNSEPLNDAAWGCDRPTPGSVTIGHGHRSA